MRMSRTSILAPSPATAPQLTAPTASSDPSTRSRVGCRFPSPLRPTQSKISPPTTCPATTAMPNIASPSGPAAVPWVTTKKIPQAPPASVHQGSVLERSPEPTRRNPVRAFGERARITSRIVVPVITVTQAPL
ncbi:MAG: hypothetical protein QOE37_367 [Microbacteriaceae bacterium]|nr:hypothetical protein [Microbacteriaceae bacterium]